MKNGFLILFCYGYFAGAQNIVFPDPVFKAKLLTSNQFISPVGFDQNHNYIVIDANSDGEISQTEALAVYEMLLDAGDITDITGIGYFQNLATLWIVDNPIVTVDISNLNNLKRFTCDSSDTLSAIALNAAVEELSLQNALLTSLNVSLCPNLKKLNCQNNLIPAIDLSANLQLIDLNLANNELAALDVSHLVNLHSLQVNVNDIPVLDVSDLDQLRVLSCSNNQISELDVAGKSYMEILNFRWNQISEIDLTGVGQLAPVNWFVDINADSNQLSTIDTSVMGQGTRVRLACEYNPDLSNINVMNGITFFDVIWGEPPLPGPGVYLEGLPNLTHICADAVNFPYLEEKIASYGYTGIAIDSACVLADDEFVADAFVLYPNPAKNVLNIQSKNGAAVKSVSIYNMLGQLLLTESGNAVIDVTSLAIGNYIVKVNSGKGILTSRFVKE